METKFSNQGKKDPGQHKHYGAQVVMKFQDFIEFNGTNDYEAVLEKRSLGGWKTLAGQFPGIELQRMITSVKEERLEELVHRASEMDHTYKPVNFKNYFYINCPVDVSPEKLVNELKAWRSVQNAYVDYPAPDPAVNALDDPRAVDQDYLDAAPTGIDARYAWNFAGGDGAGQSIIDMERGWTLNHEDITSHGPALLHGSLLDSSRAHGTSVLGEICATDNTLGCVGIVPHVATVNVVSYNGSSRPNAIIAALDNLLFGDVLLLEAQVYIPGMDYPNMLGPCEVLDADFDAIRLATALGIIVVEAGGNGTNNGSAPPLDMDAYTDLSGRRILFRDAANPDFRDSGAIIVSAATSSAPHTRLAYAPHGRRIDCYAWGQNINTLTSNSMGSSNIYTSSFSGTSGASPIITGSALAVQGMVQNNFGFRLSPRQMRALLSNVATGTLPSATETTQIGVMPDLKSIIDTTLNLAPDIYLRDFVGDEGEPHSGPISSSPDIILRKTEVMNPQAAFGEGSGTENSNTLSTDAEIGQDNFLYVRVLNQGASPATNVKATVYWSSPATLITPDLWTKIGDVSIANVPTGEVLTVSDKITWPSAAIPAAGHYCFVGLIGNDNDPAPDPADFLIWDNFTRFIKENNNVTWKNFNVVDMDPAADPTVPKGFLALPFLVPGAPDKNRVFALEVISKLPAGSRLFLEMPSRMIRLLDEHPAELKYEKRRGGFLPVAIKPSGKHPFREIELKAKSRNDMRLFVQVPKAHLQGEFTIAVRQLWEKQEVGRITWKLVPPEKKKAIEKDDFLKNIIKKPGMN